MSAPDDPPRPEARPRSAAEHNARMKELKAVQDAEVRSKTIRRGVVVVHTGHGKGKSTAGFGVALRAAGHGQRVSVIQFVKGTWKTGEQAALKRFPEITHTVSGDGFTWNTQDRDQDIASAQKGWAVATAHIASGDYDVVVLDELNIALRYEYLDADEVAKVLRGKPASVSVIVTGRDAPQAVIDAADTVTDHTLIKHAYKAGIRARKGVEF
ncbi:MAG: cob(I)yrinic acid a,c-diamide adenosyltransferase [Myxococcota bacterium]|nr:cob(I)yrinic acid a,c-diamide adenosyltransferase [Myxococcota bacterium]MEC8422570.1 cob(I)yrinic acid a,c-diamide adenosyltransferase [Myxococcota bacterium]